MKPRRPVAREYVIFTVVVIALAIIAGILWFRDPTHQPSGQSRVEWPPPAPAKP